MTTMRDVDIRHLEALVAVAEEGTFGRAATRLGFTQSAVSQQIAALERAIGLAVFDRPKGPRRVEITTAGRLLLEHAHAMLERVDAMSDELDRLRRGISGQLVVGTFQSVSAEVLPTLIRRMRTELPSVDIALFETDDQEVLVQRLLDDELDLAFTVDATDDRLVRTVLGEDPFVVIVAADDLPGPTASPDDLDGHPIIGQPPSNVCQILIDERLAAHGVRPDYVFRSTDNGAVQGMVRSGMGRAIMPSLAVDPNDPGIRILRLEPPIPPRTIQLTRRAGRTLIPAADHFAAVAAEVCAGLLGSAAAA